MKPIIILPPDTMSADDIKLLRENDLCVVVSNDPAKVKFVDPIPAASSRNEIENAAISLSRVLLNAQWGSYTTDDRISRATIARIYCDLLTKGTPLASSYRDPAAVEKEIFDSAKADEIRRIAREEARETHRPTPRPPSAIQPKANR